jgi:hypothetical protein
VGFSAIPEGEVVSGGGVVNGGVTVTARAGNTKAGALNALAEGQLARDALGATVSALQVSNWYREHEDFTTVSG